MIPVRRTALLLILVFAVAAGAVWTAVDGSFPLAGGVPGNQDADALVGDGAAAAVSPDDADDPVAPRRRRVRMGDDAAEGEPTGAIGPVTRNPLDPAVISAAQRAAQQELLRRIGLDVMQLVDTDPALHATPARDPVTETVAVVAAGDPPEMPFATFLEHGSAAIDGAAELVGTRRPRLETGVPVALSGRVLAAIDDGSATEMPVTEMPVVEMPVTEMPVVGASVVVTSTFYVRATFYDHHLREVARAVTDHEGRWSIERLNADPAHFGRGGRAYVTVTAGGYAPALGLPIAQLSPGVANRLDDVRLDTAPHTLTGRVVDIWNGAPVAGARVIATGAIDPVVYPKDQREALFVGAPTATTDADGRFVLDGLGRGVQMVSVHGGDDCVGRESFRLPHKDEVVLRTRAIGGRVEGEVLDARGDPVPLVLVDGGANSTHSFADGRFVLENIRGDKIQMRFVHAEFMPVTLTDVPDGAVGLVVRMERRRPIITLDVRAADHEAPIEHVEIRFAFPEGMRAPAGTSPHHIAPSGRHDVVLPVGAIALTVSADTFVPATVDLANRTDGDTVVTTLRVATEPLPGD